MSTSQPVDFALIPGAVAWARRDSPSASGLWWPVVLYPTWASAAKDSGLMDLSATQSAHQGNDDKQSSKQLIPLVGVKRPVNLTYLKENKVPKAVVLRPRPAGAGPMARPGPQNRVVAHFLGLSTPEHVADASMAAWGAVDMASLRPYRRDCRDVLAACRGKVGRDDWVDLLRAMDEAAMVLDDWTIASKELLQSVPEEKQSASSTKKASAKSTALRGKADNVVDTAKNDDNNKDNDNDDDEESLGQTPEFYDDWKGTESQSQRNTQFSQVFNFSQAQSYTHGAHEAGATEEKAEVTTGTNADLASVEMDDKKNPSADTDSEKNGAGDEASVTTVKTTNVVESGVENTTVSDSTSTVPSNEEEKEPTASVAEEDATNGDAAAHNTRPTIAAATTGDATESETSPAATEEEANEIVVPTEVVQKENEDGSEEKKEQKDEQTNEEEKEEQPVISQEEETKPEGEKEAEGEAESDKVVVANAAENTAENIATDHSEDEELSDYGPESQDISDFDTQQHSNLTDPACIISPKDGGPKNSKRRDLASILGHKKIKKTMGTSASTTPFVSSKGSTKKVSPSPMADAAAADSVIGSINDSDEEIEEGLESKRLFEGNVSGVSCTSEKRKIESVGCEGRDVDAKKLRGGDDEAHFSAEELEADDEDMHFFTQQG